MPIQVKSEIGRLREVLLHRPGGELEQLTPDTLELLLFDDIPYLMAAQQEHDQFAALLREHGVRVRYVADLTAEALAADAEIRRAFIEDFIQEAGIIARHCREPLREYLSAINDSRELVLRTMTGVHISEVPAIKRGPLSVQVKQSSPFILDPIPNLYFTRDPFASIGRGVSVNHMYSATRNRETIYSRYILRHHPQYSGNIPFYYHHDEPFSIEGGDILNLSASVLAVGLSQRTSVEAIERLAENLFANPSSEIDTILVLDIPNLRAYMHLDTVFTQVDQGKFTIHPAILDHLSIYVLRKKDGGAGFTAEQEAHRLEDVLCKYLRLDTCSLIHCGGSDYVASAREQWNDGANTLAIAPGVVVVYDRNTITNRILEENGVTVLKILSSELSRGRGGPRCMTMPIYRDAVAD